MKTRGRGPRSQVSGPVYHGNGSPCACKNPLVRSTLMPNDVPENLLVPAVVISPHERN